MNDCGDGNVVKMWVWIFKFHSKSTLLDFNIKDVRKEGKFLDKAKEMEARTNELKEYRFGFERKLTISGRSLSLGIPSELASQLNLKKGQKVKIYPVSNEGILIKKA